MAVDPISYVALLPLRHDDVSYVRVCLFYCWNIICSVHGHHYVYVEIAASDARARMCEGYMQLPDGEERKALFGKAFWDVGTQCKGTPEGLYNSHHTRVA